MVTKFRWQRAFCFFPSKDRSSYLQFKAFLKIISILHCSTSSFYTDPQDGFAYELKIGFVPYLKGFTFHRMLKGMNSFNAAAFYVKYLVSTFLFIYCWWISCVLQEKVKAVFDNLIQLEHLNIVKFHKYWADVKENRARVRGCCLCKLKSPFVLLGAGVYSGFADTSFFLPQVIFITEYMSSGSLKQFLKKTKKNHKTMNEKVRDHKRSSQIL